MKSQLAAVVWPPARIGEALERLASAAGLTSSSAMATSPRPPAPCGLEAVERTVAAAAAALGIEAEPLAVRYGEIGAVLRRSAPALVRLATGVVALSAVRRGTARLLGPTGVSHRIPVLDLAAVLGAELLQTLAAPSEPELDDLGIESDRAESLREHLLADELGTRSIGPVWILRRSVSSPLFGQLRAAGILVRIAGLFAAHLASVLAAVVGWWVLGEGALSGRIDTGWLAAWILSLLTQLPFRAAVVWLQVEVSARVGALIKRRLLAGALGLDPDGSRGEGAGQMLGSTLEAVALEELVLSGGFVALFAFVDLGLSFWLLDAGAAGALHDAVLVVAIGASLLLGWRTYRRQRTWTDARLERSRELIENMLGHRTRLVQEEPGEPQLAEDAVLASSIELARVMDRSVVWLRALPQVWLVMAVLALVPAFIRGPLGEGAVAMTVAGALLARQALAKLVEATTDFAGAAIAWRRVAPLFRTPVISQRMHVPAPRLGRGTAKATGAPILEAEGLTFTRPGRVEPVFRALDLSLYVGDRVLLEGPSGGGKSTLGSVLAGLRRADDGWVLLDGLDPSTVGSDEWRRRVVLAPQFHENHVVTDSLAFNLLMGNRWPPAEDDLGEAARLLEELGLGPLIERMPAGLMQTVGEGGWRLSHGERSRIYLARALLQDADVVVLDETFGALDPALMAQAIACACRRARTLMVISHE